MHVGNAGYDQQMFADDVGVGGYAKQIYVGKQNGNIGGGQDFVGVGGLQSSEGAGVGAGVRGDVGKESSTAEWWLDFHTSTCTGY